MTPGARLAYALRLALGDPRLLADKLAWRLRALRRVPVGEREGVIGGSVRFRFPVDARGPVWFMYHGGYEVELVRLLRRRLPPGGTFIDVGANLGYLSAVAAACVGPTGSVHAFEPDPAMADRLADLAARNPQRRILVNRCALAAAEERAELAVAGDNLGWKTLVPGFMAAPVARHAVSCRRFDDYARERGLVHADLIKIDTEGYELPVLQGMRGFLGAARPKPLICCEVAPAAYPRLGSSLAALATLVAELGYAPRTLQDPRRAVDFTALTVTTDVLLVPAP